MPRTRDETSTLLSDFNSRLERLVAAARREGREAALAEVRALVGGGGATAESTPSAARPKRRAAKRARSGAKRANPWAKLSPEQRLARVNAIRKGRGLPPKEKL